MEMQRCGGGGCGCGMFHGPNYSCGLSMIWPAAAVTAVNHHQRQQQQHYNWDDQAQLDDVYSVDCTLSLGTPATRKSGGAGEKKGHERRSSVCLTANFCWDFLEHGGGGGGGGGNGMSGKGGGGRGGNGCGGGEMLLARRCANCDTTSTPLWRNGPRGPKSLCNACGIRYKKEERRATAAAAATASLAPDHQHHHHHISSSTNYYNNSWNGATQYPIQTHQTIQCFPMQY